MIMNGTISKPFYPPTLTTFVPPYNANRIRNVVMPRLTIRNTSTDVSIRSPSGDNTPNPPTHTVINLSDTALRDPQVKLLSRGLKFCPTPKEHNQLSLQQGIAHFNRRLRLREFFHIEPSTDDETPYDSPSGAPSQNRFKEKSVWVLPKNRDAALDNNINAVNSEVYRESPS